VEANAAKPDELKIQPSQVRVGVHVRIPLSWMDHPFLTSSFVVTTEEQVKEILALGIDVFADPRKSRQQPLPLPAVVAAPDPAQEAELAVLRERREAQLLVKSQRLKAMAAMREKLDAVQKHFISASEQTGNAFQQLGSRPEESIRVIQGVAQESTAALLADPDSAIILIADKARSQGEVAHALSVMTLSLLLAKQLNLGEKAIQIIGMGALLHDIGKAGINHSILRNPARNRFEEAVYQSHCKLGFEELQRCGVAMPQGVLDAVLHHHEREDGQGFPGLKRPGDIPLSARIVGIANRFDDLTNPLDVRAAVSPFEALGLMWTREKAAFDDSLLQMFVRTMGIYPPGTLVQTSDGRVGVVVAAAPPSARLCPQVLVYDAQTPRREAIILDLADPDTARQVKIEKALRTQDRPEDEVDYLLPRRKMSWFRASNP
jgi:putative nucleotidyltransferase with HDIG domain